MRYELPNLGTGGVPPLRERPLKLGTDLVGRKAPELLD